MKLSPAVDLLWRVAVREAVNGRCACIEPEHLWMALTTGREGRNGAMERWSDAPSGRKGRFPC